MNPEYRRARLLAFCLDLAIPMLAADAVGLLLAALVWRALPAAREAAAWIFPAVGIAALGAFLLRDARGGRARRWLALEVRGRSERMPGAWASIRRNLPLLVPGWNVLDAWPVFRDGLASRRSDRGRGLHPVVCD